MRGSAGRARIAARAAQMRRGEVRMSRWIRWRSSRARCALAYGGAVTGPSRSRAASSSPPRTRPPSTLPNEGENPGGDQGIRMTPPLFS